MSDFQRTGLDLSGLFLFIVGFLIAVHFRANAPTACVFFFGAVAFFASLICGMVAEVPFAYKLAWFACFASALTSAASFVLLFMMVVA